jgi:hypothetical protein
VGLAVFTLGTLGCALSHTLPALVASGATMIEDQRIDEGMATSGRRFQRLQRGARRVSATSERRSLVLRAPVPLPITHRQ